MAQRLEARSVLAEGMVETPVTVENYFRAMTRADLMNSTAVGKGTREFHVGVEWLVSAYLACANGSLKNCVQDVRTISLLKPCLSYVNNRGHHSGGGPGGFVNSDTFAENETLFGYSCALVTDLAYNWGSGWHRQAIQGGWDFAIWLGDEPNAQMSRATANQNWWSVVEFRQDVAQNSFPDSGLGVRTPRGFRILLRHLEMLAILYADTLRHENPEDAGSIKAPHLKSLLGKQAKPASSSPNEKTGSFRGEPVPFRDQDQNSMDPKRVNNAEGKREKYNSQASSSRGLPRKSVRTKTHGQVTPTLHAHA